MAASGTSVIQAERWLDQVVLVCNFSNYDGDISLTIGLPAGIGDVAIIEAKMYAGPLATSVATPEFKGISMSVVSAGSVALVDIVGVERWVVGTPLIAYLSAYFSPDPLVLWRQNELLTVEGQEVDTNGAPTVDFAVIVKAVRVRPLEQPGSPIQLVR